MVVALQKADKRSWHSWEVVEEIFPGIEVAVCPDAELRQRTYVMWREGLLQPQGAVRPQGVLQPCTLHGYRSFSTVIKMDPERRIFALRGLVSELVPDGWTSRPPSVIKDPHYPAIWWNPFGNLFYTPDASGGRSGKTLGLISREEAQSLRPDAPLSDQIVTGEVLP